jgi:CBS domain-containing protein
MKVKEIMTTDVVACRRHANLAEVVMTMRRRACGCVPVVSAAGYVEGMLTDRDIAIAVGTKGRTADRIEASEAMSNRVYACSPNDTIQDVLQIMRTRKVRRLPVVDELGHLRGLVSLDDLAQHAGRAHGAGLASDDVLATLQGIRAPVGPALPRK